MRRDLVYYYARPLDQVFAAFVQAAKQKFGKDCKIDQGKTVSFGLNFSFKYNMNGGSLTLHFMPYQGGTAVNLRYSIVQAMGARYKAHARDLTLFVNGILGVTGSIIQLDVNQFLAYAKSAPEVSAWQEQQAAPMQLPQEDGGRVCPKCGAVCSSDARFCVGCGMDFQKQEEPQPEEPKAQVPAVCANCGAQLRSEGKFCHRCGAKRS